MVFPIPVDFSGLSVYKPLTFVESTFRKRVQFEEATLSFVNFWGATFEAHTSFRSTVFEVPAEHGDVYSSFRKAIGEDPTEHGAVFWTATFEAQVQFSGATFRAPADFNGARFRGPVSFEGTSTKADQVQPYR